jgi:cyclopropane fatty-acyl-phospholipid synthase-like methyltransferase
MDWKKHYTEQPTLYAETDFLKQVGKTVSGQPITLAQLAAQVSDIQKALNVCSNDHILDLCCGNGVITARISKVCDSIVGVDFSEPLIRIAEKYNNPGNVTYVCMSALDPKIRRLVGKPFTKVYMYEALQHFDEADLPGLLALVIDVSASDAVIFLGGIPDKDRIWEFYDTEERREEYRRRKSENREAIGTWWSQKKIADVCDQNGLDCETVPQSPLLHSAHYRFDVRLAKRDRLKS